MIHRKLLRRILHWCWLIRNAKRNRRTIDINARCPGCGHRQGYIELRREDKAIAHHCLICGAEWGESTIISAGKWL